MIFTLLFLGNRIIAGDSIKKPRFRGFRVFAGQWSDPLFA